MKIRVIVESGKMFYHNNFDEILNRYTTNEIKKSYIDIIYNSVVIGIINPINLTENKKHIDEY